MTKENTEYGYVKDGDVYLKGYFDLPDRKIGVVKESEEASLQYFIDRFARVEEKVKEVEEAVATAQNKGSFLMKIIHLYEYLKTYNGIGDFPSLYDRLKVLEDEIKGYVAENRVKNTEIKQDLFEQARAYKDSTDWDEAAEALKELKMQWIRTGSVGDDEDDISQEFDAILDEFFARRKAHFEEEKILTKERLDKYNRIVRELRRISNEKERNELSEEEIHLLRGKVIALQKEWKEIGQIVKWKYLKVWKKYKKEIDRFFGNPPYDKPQSQRYASSSRDAGSDSGFRRDSRSSGFQPRKPAFDPVSLTPAEVVMKKKQICETVEKMADELAGGSLNEVKAMQGEWKQLGIIKNDPVDREYNNRFHMACSELFNYSFLLRAAQTEFEGFDDKTNFEQLKIKIKITKDTIKEDEPALQNLADQAPTDDYGRPMFDRTDKRRFEYMNLLNKIRTHKRLLKKFQNQLMNDYY
ncbi:MAG: DUF349 domain-containing protein [Bernardetiaceae bacterium]|nr:DUF349 domain-containing protein [Bernardetiaceae bacterium]